MPGFDRHSARRIAEATRRIEKSPRNKVAGRRTPAPMPGVLLAVTTSTVTARSGASPNFTLGRGTVAILGVAVDGSSVATTFDSGSTATIYHGGTATVAAGRLVQYKWAGTIIMLDVDYC